MGVVGPRRAVDLTIAALAHVSLGLAAVWVTAPGEGGPRALGGVATLTPLFDPLWGGLRCWFCDPRCRYQ